MNPFDAASPLDARYYFADASFFAKLHPFVSESAQVRYLARVEGALASTLADVGVCPRSLADEIAAACLVVTPEEVYAEERRIQHNIRALVNCIGAKVSPEAKRFVHLFATSADVMDSARALCLADVTRSVLVPDLKGLIGQIIAMARAHADTPQMGRTHGQHAVPLTFGFAVSLYVSRLGVRLEGIARAAKRLTGKFAGAVGAYNAISLWGGADPAEVEGKLMARLGLERSEVSSQVVQPEPLVDFVFALVSAWGVLANLADDFRHLQRSEIREIRDRKAADPNTPIVGSSTMPHKVNPKDFENVKSLWKVYMPRMTTALLDQISEHQRDLTNSASMRFITELVTAFAYGVHRTSGAVSSVEPDVQRMRELLDEGKDPVTAEPLYVLLALSGHPDAHEAARVLAREARQRSVPLAQVIRDAPNLQNFLKGLTPEQRRILDDPANYRGAAAERTRAVCDEWERRLLQIA